MSRLSAPALLCFATAVLMWDPVLVEAQVDAALGSYSVEPLRTDPVLENDALETEAKKFGAWLTKNFEQLDAEARDRAREHLFFLIDARVKHLYKEHGEVMPVKGSDRVLAELFMLAESLGSYGGTLIYNNIRAADLPVLDRSRRLPEPMHLNLAGNVLQLTSESGWSFSIPYYFMLWHMASVSSDKAANGMPAEVVTLSTGVARHSDGVGASQSTIMLVYSPAVEHDAFSASWRNSLAIPADTDSLQLPIEGLSSRSVFAPERGLHSELVTWAGRNGSFAVIYGGIDGPFQANRVHFLDFLRSLSEH